MKEKYIIDEDVRLGALPCCRYLVAVLLLFVDLFVDLLI